MRQTLRCSCARDSLGKDPRVQASAAQPLDTAVRARFEPLLGHDFSNVRVHTDSRAPEGWGAAAFTVGEDVTFGPGWYSPDTASGQRLLAHELTHVVQYAKSPPRTS